MKNLLMLVVILTMGIGTSFGQVVTFQDRITRYFPILNPRPCSVWMLDWNSSESEVMAESKRLGLSYQDSARSDDNKKKFLIFKDPDKGVHYNFIFGEFGYEMFICQLTYKSPADAQSRLNDLSNEIWLYWGAKERVSNSVTDCDQTGQKVGIRGSRDKSDVTLTFFIIR